MTTNNAGTTNNNRSVNTGNTIPVDPTDTGLDGATGTIEGANDNYIVKISKDAQTDSEFRQALEKEYGDLTDIRYYAMDISLYNPDGVTKIEAPEGVKVTLTVPLPNDMAVYGGNNKVGAVVNGDQLEKLGVRFSSIDGQPCATFTATHFSPYGFYVDINNLSAAGDLDATPKTGDPISPKWFFSIGLAALSIFLFLKKDPRPSAEPQG